MAKMRLSPPKCKCSLKFSLDLFLIMYTGTRCHCRNAGSGAQPQPGWHGGPSPPSQKIYNCFHFIKKQGLSIKLRKYFEYHRHLVSKFDIIIWKPVSVLCGNFKLSFFKLSREIVCTCQDVSVHH